jgi:hypothetical protein
MLLTVAPFVQVLKEVIHPTSCDPLKPERVAAYMAGRSLAIGGVYAAVKHRALEIISMVPEDLFVREPAAAPTNARARRYTTGATGYVSVFMVNTVVL